MMISKVEPLNDAIYLLEQVHKMRVASESEDPIVIGCHCTDTGDGLLICIWCNVQLFLESRKEGEMKT